METDRILTGDCLSVLQDLESESAHAIVTDPPYGLAFMGRGWDDFEPKEYQGFCENWARRAKDVLKPGGHLLAFSGNRTHHRLFTGVEDAGYEIRDTLTWHYGSGFPKASDISKYIDKRERGKFVEQLSVDILERAGVPNPQATYHDWTEGGHAPGDGHWQTLKDGIDGSEGLQRDVIARIEESASSDKFSSVYGDDYHGREYEITDAATDKAKKWDGWKTGLKPATEYIVMARKPFDGATVDCVLEHGTGTLNIDACRIDSTDGGWERKGPMDGIRGANYNNKENDDKIGDEDDVRTSHEEGRYPSNVVFDETEAERLDEQVGDVDGCKPKTLNDSGERSVLSDGALYGGERETGYDDSGGPSRYFYTSKASKAERTLDGKIDNSHPTVKPQDLMEWLIKLVTREDQIVLDPFAGSGTTCKAAKELNRRFIGIEKQSKWADVARVRCGLTPNDPSVVRDDESQQGLESYDEN